MFVEDISLDSAQSASISQNFLSNQQRNCIFMVGSLKSQNDMNVVGLGKISDFSSHVFGCSSFVAIVVQNGRVEFIVDQIDKLVVVLDTSCRDDYFFGAES